LTAACKARWDEFEMLLGSTAQRQQATETGGGNKNGRDIAAV